MGFLVFIFEGRYDTLVKDYNEAMKLLHREKELVSKLERDLMSVNALSARFRGEGEGQAAVVGANIIAEAIKDRVEDSAVAVTMQMTAGQGDTGTVELISAAESLLPIISSQRERFRQRVQELEVDNLRQQQKLHLAEGEVEKLRSDNLELYEKIKFLQSYRGQGSSKGKGDSAAEREYSSQYEERLLDPFSTFGRRERQRKYQSLSPFDKMTFSLGRFILSSKTGRAVTFFYTLLLHSLVFLVLYKLAYTESWSRDISSNCAQRFADHMQQIHGEVLHRDQLDPI